MAGPRTMLDKIWDAHAVAENEAGETLLFVDRQLLHEGSRTAFGILEDRGLSLARPDLTFGTADHYAPSDGRDLSGAPDAVREMVEYFDRNTQRHGVAAFGLNSADQGIVHVIGPELGLTLPGLVLVCGDSHTATHGALGALAFGIGASEVAHVMATQTLWQKKPRAMRITVDGRLGDGVTAKDLILAIIARIGTAGGTGHVIEYAGDAVAALAMEQRLTLCNMSIEAGARAGFVAPDTTTFDYVRGRRYAPEGALFERAVADWQRLPSDDGAAFDTAHRLDGAAVAPMVTWGTSPQAAVAVTGRVPMAGDDDDRAALAYMGLSGGETVSDIAIDRVFIGSCTNGRLGDLRAAAAIARSRRARVPVLVSPGSSAVRRAAEAEGLDRIFTEAGFTWGHASCSMCVGINGDLVDAGQRCLSTSNRNFVGRQGRGARTHLASPATAAASAIAGRIVDHRAFPGAL
ncbi:MAG: 3-isopropylmalate dehydratase large subunit [Alphaproteobacteria bacterium]